MAESLAHTWGQIIGDMLESAFHDIMDRAAKDAGVYLDYNGNARAGDCGVRNKGKLAWKDQGDNWHQLDFVYERGGTKQKVGVPVAFVEIAWRRYTKHSKNKAQEIAEAVVALAETHRHSLPFLGAILGGKFTAPSLAQLQSRGFALIYVPYDDVLGAFAAAGIDASYDEGTPEVEYGRKIAAFGKLDEKKRQAIRMAIIASARTQIDGFVKQLKASVARQVVAVLVFPLHGDCTQVATISDAIAFVSKYVDDKGTKAGIVRYEIEVRFSNGATVRGQFPTKAEATAFLRAQSA